VDTDLISIEDAREKKKERERERESFLLASCTLFSVINLSFS